MLNKLTDGNFADGDKCDECEAGTYQPESSKDTCLTCDADKGHFQPVAGETYCKKTRPGYQLDEGSNKSKKINNFCITFKHTIHSESKYDILRSHDL